MSLKKSLFKNSIASFFSKITMLLIRLLQVPIFISSLGVTEYGYWLVISSLPSWLAISSLGFGNVAANQIAMSAGSGDFKKASAMFSTTLFLIGVITLMGFAIISLLLWFLPNSAFYGASLTSTVQIKWAVLWLSLTVFISFSAEVFGGRLRAVNKAHQTIILGGFKPWLEFIMFIIILRFTHRFDYLALVSLISIIAYIVVIAIISRASLTKVAFSIVNIDFRLIKDLFKKGMAFQAFPLGNALLFQGNILVVETILGPIAVVLFSTARTLVRSVNQTMEMVNQIVSPEFSILFGKNDFGNVRRLHRLSVLASVSSALFFTILLIFAGIPLYTFWTGKALVLSETSLMLFLLPIPFNALWYTSSVVHAACNKHEALAVRYLLACSISLASCFLLAKVFGIQGAAVSTIFADLLLIRFVILKSLVLTNDTLNNFLANLVSDGRNYFHFLLQKIKIKA